jgi:PAS domain-containing protein
MILTAATLHVLLLAVSAAVTAALAGFAWRRRQEPGALPFVLLMVAVTVWTGCYATGLVTLNPRWRPLWESVQWFGTATVPVWFLLFALEYTGNDDLITRRSVAGLLAVPAATLALVWTNPWHHLMWEANRLVVVDGVALMLAAFGPWFWVSVAYSYGLILLAAGLIVRLVFRSDYLFAGQSALLLVGTAAPVAGNVVAVFVSTEPLPGLDPTPYAFVVTGLAFGYALFRRRLFELVPATRQLGRNAAISQLENGVVIVDTARQVVYLNPAAADVFDCDPEDPLGEPVDRLVDRETVSFDSDDALARLDRGDRSYELRTSPITDRRDRPIGHTLVVTDVTARERRERRLARQRDELRRVNRLNGAIRGVNAALVSAGSREEMAEAICDGLADSGLYRAACMADLPTWTGDADRWTVADTDGQDRPLPAVDEADLEAGQPATGRVAPGDEGGEEPNDWTVVPITRGRTVYGAIGLLPVDGVSDREREVLGELGQLVGHAIDAVETRRLLADEAVVEVDLASTDDGDPLVAAADRAGCRVELAGLVPATDEGGIAYLRVEDAPVATAVRELGTDGEKGSPARAVREPEDDDGGLLEWTAGGDSLLGRLIEQGGRVTRAVADGDGAHYTVEVASDADVRALVERVTAAFPESRLEARRELEHPVEPSGGVPEAGIEELTDRQREAMEAAYRAGYFRWPRDSTAEEIAETLDISAPTLHAHLRKAEDTLLGKLFETDGRSHSD